MRGLLRPRAASASLRRRGLSMILLGFVLILLMVFVSLGVDVGRIRLARAQLQTAADSSARSGARALPTSSDYVIEHASDAAAENQVIDSSTNANHLGERSNPGVELEEDEDIHFGTWNPAQRTFTEIFDNGSTDQDERRFANAVKTDARRLESRDNPVPLIFAPVLGVMHSSIERDATAYITGGPVNYGFIGLDSVTSNGNGATVRNEKTGALFGGGVASDGNIDLGNGDVYGDARPGIGKTLTQGPNSVVTGWAAPLDYKLAPLYPPYTMADASEATVLTGLKKNKPLVIAGGPASEPAEYFINGNLDHPDPLQVTNGYAIIYVNGDINVQGNQVINSPAPSDPAKLTIRVIGNHEVDLGGSSQQYMHLYAPTSTVRVHGTPGYHGWIVGKTLAFIGTSNLYYDDTNKHNAKYLIRLVE